jgi:topoisomerase-4 subunit A
MKRFQVTSITRDKLYDLTPATPGTEVLHFTVNPNGEAEIVTVYLRALQRLKKLKFEIDFAELAIKGRSAKGNTATKYPIKKIEIKEEGVSTLAARKIWFDEAVYRLNTENRGRLLGSFSGEDKILEVCDDGLYRILPADLNLHFSENATIITKYQETRPLSAVYYDGEKDRHFVKRFIPEVEERKELFISDSKDSKLEYVSLDSQPRIEIVFRKINGKQKDSEEVNLSEFISVKGEKAQGNQLSRDAIRKINILESLLVGEESPEDDTENNDTENNDEHDNNKADDSDGQITLSLD